MNWIQISEIRLTENEIDAAVSVLRSGALRQGKECRAFEEEFAARVGCAFAVAVSSGSAALHLAYLTCLKPGDEVLVPSFTFIATASMAAHSGAVPVFCDVDRDTFLLDLDDAETRLTPRTKAVAPVHLFGNPCDITKVKSFASKHGLRIIWDAAQAHGAEFDGRDVGSVGDVVCYSFYPSKNMFVGEGGMVCTNDAELADKMRYLRSHGQTGKYYHTMLGLNYRMTDVEAAIGREQLKRLDGMLAARRENARVLNGFLAGFDGLRVQKITTNSQHAWHQYCVVVDPDKYGCDRDSLAERLNDKGIATGIHYPRGLHQQPVFQQIFGASRLPATEYLAERILALPVHHGLRPAEINRIIEALAENRK